MRDVGLRAPAHAPSVPAGRPGCDGYAGASRQPGGRLSSGPRRPGRASSRAPLWRAPRDLGRSPGSPCGARVGGDFCPGPIFGSPAPPPLELRGSSLESFDGQRLRHHCWRLAATGRPGPPGSRAFRKALLPGAGRCHVKNGVHSRPVAGSDARSLPQRQGSGDKSAAPSPRLRGEGRGEGRQEANGWCCFLALSVLKRLVLLPPLT